MKIYNEDKLDNPVWHSLGETHHPFSINFGNLRCYNPAFAPFAGCKDGKNNRAELDQYSQLTSNFFIVGEKPDFSKDILLKTELVCHQMTMEHPPDLSIREEIVFLNENYEPDVFELVNQIQPGYFKGKTIYLGDYYGIFKEGNLVAVAGERMKMNDFIEVSAIVTHPGYRGMGYAMQLIAFTVNRIFDKSLRPYLHVAATNIGAIKLYEKLGFKFRRQISFWNAVRK